MNNKIRHLEWNCWKCNKRNDWRNGKSCIECKAPRERPSDWICVGCHYLNFGRNDHCIRCNVYTNNNNKGPKTRHGDWKCSECGTLSYASRTHCYGCKKEKESVVIENTKPSCPICFSDDTPFSLLSPCGHQCCKDCAIQLTECHICRSEIKENIRIYGL